MKAPPRLILGIESTCDETAASVVVDGTIVRSSVVASQAKLHEKFRGVVPEIASRAHIENILPVLREALSDAHVSLEDLDAIAVAHRPGLIGSLLIGVTAAKTLAWCLGKPLIAIDHVHAHLYSVLLQSPLSLLPETPTLPPLPVLGERLTLPPLPVLGERPTLSPLPVLGERQGEGSSSVEKTGLPPNLPLTTGRGENPALPAIGLVCSGGHTALYYIRDWLDISLIGSTIDDAVGEAYDKVATILGLGYPGGPIIDRMARLGNPTAIKFPRSMLGRESLDFSFSGLKTAVLYHVRGVPGRDERRTHPLSESELNDIAASFQAACLDTIVKKLRRALRQFPGAKSVIIGGGVSANSGLRDAMARFELPAHFPAMEFCTDNAAMSAGLAQLYFDAGKFATLDLDAVTSSHLQRIA